MSFRKAMLITLLASSISCTSLDTVKRIYIPTSAYAKFEMSEIHVYMSPKVTEQRELAKNILSRLNEQLKIVNQIIPKDKFDLIRKTNIWVELRAKEKKSAEFHVDIEWLNLNYYNPEKLLGIEIPNVNYYLKTTIPGKQQYAILHEFTHALHETLTDEQKELVLSAYESAKSSGLYRNVPRFGKAYRKNSYALADEYEYLAELTEAYFGINDWFPHIRYQLRDYDSKGYHLIEKIWLK